MIYPINFNYPGQTYSLEIYEQQRLAFYTSIKDKDSEILERDKQDLKPKGIFGHLYFFFDQNRSMKLHEILEVLKKRALSDDNN